MKETTKRGAREGIAFGFIAGLILLVAEVIAAAAATGVAPQAPLRMASSIVLGQEALTTSTTLATAVIVGLIVHAVLSMAFGALYGVINAMFSTETETNYARQSGLGLAFGAALWLVNFQIIARVGYPWFLDTSQWLQLLMHAAFFGLPLALMYALAERRVQLVGQHTHAHA